MLYHQQPLLVPVLLPLQRQLHQHLVQMPFLLLSPLLPHLEICLKLLPSTLLNNASQPLQLLQLQRQQVQEVQQQIHHEYSKVYETILKWFN